MTQEKFLHGDGSEPAPDVMRRAKTGRPTKAEALEKQGKLLDAAADLFLEIGYKNATVELIASSVGITKRTLYSWHSDKASLFLATFRHAIDRLVEGQAATLDEQYSKDLETALREVLRFRLWQVMSPVGIKVQRMVFAESLEFPELYQMVYDRVTKPVVEFLAELLRRHAADSNLEVEDASQTATALLSMATGGPARVVITGDPLDEARVDKRVNFCVKLVLDGIRRR